MKKHWNKAWKIFNDHPFLNTNIGVVKNITNLFPNLKGKKTLEVGAGSGSDSIFLAKQQANTTTLDNSEKSLEACRLLAAKYSVDLTSIKADCRHIPFPDNFFDIVFSVGLVEHFLDPIPVIKEQFRVVKTGGYLLIDIPQKYNLYTIVKKIRMLTGSYPFGWETEYSYQNIKNWSKSLNLTIVKIYGRDSAFRIKIPKTVQPYWVKAFSLVEKSPLAPFICLNIGCIFKKA